MLFIVMACNGYKLPGIHGYQCIAHVQTKPDDVYHPSMAHEVLTHGRPTAFADMELEAFSSHPASHPAGAKNDPMIQPVFICFYIP